MDGIVISLQLRSGQWLNAEVHPHEWHFAQKLDWMLKVAAAFRVRGRCRAVLHAQAQQAAQPTDCRSAPLRGRHAGNRGRGGRTIDLRRAIRSFNAMQRQVADEMARRTGTLAAISHDVRTPLTALRVKAEMVGDRGRSR